jgi:hypothetical protein
MLRVALPAAVPATVSRGVADVDGAVMQVRATP